MAIVYNVESGAPLKVHDVDARELLARGGWTNVQPKPEIVSLEGMTVIQLRAFAKEHGITLGADATTKDTILAVIQAADFILRPGEKA
jgi:hypothetical protein